MDGVSVCVCVCGGGVLGRDGGGEMHFLATFPTSKQNKTPAN